MKDDCHRLAAHASCAPRRLQTQFWTGHAHGAWRFDTAVLGLRASEESALSPLFLYIEHAGSTRNDRRSARGLADRKAKRKTLGERKRAREDAAP